MPRSFAAGAEYGTDVFLAAPPVPMLSLLASCASLVMSGSFSILTSPPVICDLTCAGEARGDLPGVLLPIGLLALPLLSGTVRLVLLGSTAAPLGLLPAPYLSGLLRLVLLLLLLRLGLLYSGVAALGLMDPLSRLPLWSSTEVDPLLDPPPPLPVLPLRPTGESRSS